MGTLTALLNLSQNALQASQAAINITANNVANANTPGYTNEIANWQENDTVSVGGSIASAQGASVSVSSQRDPVLNQRVQQQTQQESSSAAESTALQDLQSIFGLSTTSTSAVSTTIGNDMNSFFSSLTALQASPSNGSVRQGVITAASTLASDFNGASNQITQQTLSLNSQVSSVVSEVNALTTSIAALNLQIQSNSPNSDAGTLEDQRQQDLTQLSKYIGFDQTKTENNGIDLSTANGSPLVSGGQSYALSTKTVGGNVEVLSAAGADLTSPTATSSTSTLTGGSLGGIIKARDVDLPKVSTALDSLAFAIGSAVNMQNQAGLDANGTANVAIFNLPVNLLPTAAAAGASSTISLVTGVNQSSLAAAAVGEGSSGATNATALNKIANNNIVSLNNLTASAFYASLLTQIGSMASQVANQNTTQKASLTQLTTQQSSQSSVSLDTEAANLSLYERSYNAAAKIFTIVDQLMASALNLGTQTTVS